MGWLAENISEGSLHRGSSLAKCYELKGGFPTWVGFVLCGSFPKLGVPSLGSP